MGILLPAAFIEAHKNEACLPVLLFRPFCALLVCMYQLEIVRCARGGGGEGSLRRASRGAAAAGQQRHATLTFNLENCPLPLIYFHYCQLFSSTRGRARRTPGAGGEQSDVILLAARAAATISHFVLRALTVCVCHCRWR